MPCRRRSRTRRPRPRRLAGAVPGLDAARLARQLAQRPRVRLGGAQARPAGGREGARPERSAGIYFLPREQALLPHGRAGRPGARLRRHRQPRPRRPRAGLRPRGRRQARQAHRAARRPPRHRGLARPLLRRARAGARPPPDARRHGAAHRRARAGAGGRGAAARSSGSAVFLDPATGGVLAMATYPSFDPNHFGGYSPEPLAQPGDRRRLRAGLDLQDRHRGGGPGGRRWCGPTTCFDCEMGGDHPARHPHPRPQALRPPDLRAGARQVEQRRGDQGSPCGSATSGSTPRSAASASAG